MKVKQSTSVDGGPDISEMIEKSGCSIPYYSLEECLGEKNRDWKQCQKEVADLRICYQNKQQKS
jgi:hypothetical protein